MHGSVVWENFRGRDGGRNICFTDIIPRCIPICDESMVLNIFYSLLLGATPAHARRGGSSLSPQLHGHNNGLSWVGLPLFAEFVQYEIFFLKKKDWAFQMRLINKSTFTNSVCLYMCTVCFFVTTLKSQYQPQIPWKLPCIRPDVLIMRGR